jgi:hypothetical protein
VAIKAGSETSGLLPQSGSDGEPANKRDDFVSRALEIDGYVGIAGENTFSPGCFHQIGEGTGLMIRLGDYCQGVTHLDGFGLHVERWKRLGSNEGIGEWGRFTRARLGHNKRKIHYFRRNGYVEVR